MTETNEVVELENPEGDQVFESKELSIRADDHLETLKREADLFFKSGFFTDLRDAAQAAVKLMVGKEYGLTGMQALSSLYIVNKKITMEAVVMASLIQTSGRFNYRIVEHDSETCSIDFYERSDFAVEKTDETWVRVGNSTFTKLDAGQAGLLKKDVWKNYPRNMLFGRALSNGARWYCASIFGGPVYVPEEMGKDK